MLCRTLAAAVAMTALLAVPVDAEQVGASVNTDGFAATSVVTVVGNDERLVVGCDYALRTQPDGTVVARLTGRAKHLSASFAELVNPADVYVGCEFRGTATGTVAFSTPWVQGHAWVEQDQPRGRPSEICVFGGARWSAGNEEHVAQCRMQPLVVSTGEAYTELTFDHPLRDEPGRAITAAEACLASAATCDVRRYVSGTVAGAAQRPRWQSAVVAGSQHVIVGHEDIEVNRLLCHGGTRPPVAC